MSTPELAEITTCMVPVPIAGMPGQFKPCGQKFSAPRVSIIGQTDARLNNYLTGLSKHLGAQHPEVGLQMAQHGAAFMELLFLRNFKTTDPELSEMQDRVRWQIHQQTLKARYPDENLEQQAHALAVTLVECADELPDEGFVNREPAIALYQSIVANAFRSIRDALEEPGKYATPRATVQSASLKSAQ